MKFVVRWVLFVGLAADPSAAQLPKIRVANDRKNQSMSEQRRISSKFSPALPRRVKKGHAMIAHIGIIVSDFEKSKNFYIAALRPIGYQMLREYGVT